MLFFCFFSLSSTLVVSDSIHLSMFMLIYTDQLAKPQDSERLFDRNLNRWYIFNVSVQRRILMNTHRLVAAIYYYDGASIEA